MAHSEALAEQAQEAEDQGLDATALADRSIDLHILTNEVGIIHAQMITHAVAPEFKLPDGSTLGDWVAAARSVHGLSVPDDVEAE